MKKLLYLIAFIVMFLWQLPQNIVGLFFWLFLRPAKVIGTHLGCVVRTSFKMRGGISLGNFVFLRDSGYPVLMTSLDVQHELGHCLQSIILGPLYLIVVGIPSLLWAATHTWIAPNKSYYWFYTEKWADALMNIDRG